MWQSEMRWLPGCRLSAGTASTRSRRRGSQAASSVLERRGSATGVGRGGGRGAAPARGGGGRDYVDSRCWWVGRDHRDAACRSAGAQGHRGGRRAGRGAHPRARSDASPLRPNLLADVREVADRVDATFDAAGKGELEDAIALTGGSERVITLADERAAELGVRLSAPTPDRAPDAVEIGMELLASGELRLRSQRSLPMSAPAKRTGSSRVETLTTSCFSGPAQRWRRSRNDDNAVETVNMPRCRRLSGPRTPGSFLGFVDRRGKRAAVDDVLVDALEPDRQRAEQLVRQALEEQSSHEVDVPARCAGDLVPPSIGERYLGRATIRRGLTGVRRALGSGDAGRGARACFAPSRSGRPAP